MSIRKTTLTLLMVKMNLKKKQPKGTKKKGEQKTESKYIKQIAR